MNLDIFFKGIIKWYNNGTEYTYVCSNSDMYFDKVIAPYQPVICNIS